MKKSLPATESSAKDAISMPIRVDLSLLGCNKDDWGVHTSRTMMLAEQTALLEAGLGDISPSSARSLIVEENVLGKGSMSSRRQTARKPIDLYLLDRSLPLVVVFLDLWETFPLERPVLAVLMAHSRDAALRSTLEWVPSLKEGQPVSYPKIMEAQIKSGPRLPMSVF